MSVLALCMWMGGCGGDSGPTSVCEVGGPCEERALHQCECCAPEQVTTCKADREQACGTGQLTVDGTPEDCTAFNQQWNAFLERGDDPCAGFDDEEVNEYCSTLMMDSFPGGG
jgi:hypothetical protein